MVAVEIAYATSTQQVIIPLAVSATCTVADAIAQSGILQQFPEIDLAVNKVGIFSKMTALDTIVKEGDRVEIYRPLLMDPKLARKLRAQKQKKIGVRS